MLQLLYSTVKRDCVDKAICGYFPPALIPRRQYELEIELNALNAKRIQEDPFAAINCCKLPFTAFTTQDAVDFEMNVLFTTVQALRLLTKTGDP